MTDEEMQEAVNKIPVHVFYNPKDGNWTHVFSNFTEEIQLLSESGFEFIGTCELYKASRLTIDHQEKIGIITSYEALNLFDEFIKSTPEYRSSPGGNSGVTTVEFK